MDERDVFFLVDGVLRKGIVKRVHPDGAVSIVSSGKPYSVPLSNVVESITIEALMALSK